MSSEQNHGLTADVLITTRLHRGPHIELPRPRTYRKEHISDKLTPKANTPTLHTKAQCLIDVTNKPGSEEAVLAVGYQSTIGRPVPGK
jgi:hypothetical protein